ncbi:MAG: hypothetical protein TUN42_04185 [Dehalogenimonas sp.]
MQITRDPEFEKGLLARIAQREFNERTGVHQSDLVYCLNKTALKKLWPMEPTTSELLTYSIGWSTQRWLTGRPDEEPIIKDGITVTLDCVADEIPWELKATYASNDKELSDQTNWLRQVMAQCYVTGKMEARLSRFSIMGNWKWVYRPSKPEKLAEIVQKYGENWEDHPTLEAWHITFTQAELETNWEYLKWRKGQYLKILETQEPLPPELALAVGQEWECSRCRPEYKEKCGGACAYKVSDDR